MGITKFTAIVLLSCYLSYPALSQSTGPGLISYTPEKIYLQLDGKVYTTDRTIWFKAIVTNALDNTPSELSGVLYVELIGPDEKVIEKKLVKLENGIGDGFFDLNKSYTEGISGGELHAEVRKSVPTLVVVDGSAINHFDYNSIPYIPSSEISSFEIIENVNNRSKVWFEFCPECVPSSLPPTIDIIAIYTYGGNGIYGIRKPKGIIKAVVPVFSASREFYTPKYANLTSSDWYKPDLRALIYWGPKLIVDSLGKASVTFYNADITGEMEVVVEAISQDGKIGYKEITYNVKTRNFGK